MLQHVLRTCRYGCDKWLGYKENHMECKHAYAYGYVSVVFFVFFTVFGSLIMLNLFIGKSSLAEDDVMACFFRLTRSFFVLGVIVTSMEEALSDLDKENDSKRKVRSLIKQYTISKASMKKMTEAYSLLSQGQAEIETNLLTGSLHDAGVEISAAKMNEIMWLVDSDFDGSVSFVEFVNFVSLMTKTHGNIVEMKRLQSELEPPKPKSDPPQIVQLKYFENKE